MPIPASGTLSITQIQTEFGGTNPISLSEYYRGGSFVPNSAINAAIPTSGAISLNNFYGSSKRSPIAFTFTTSTANAALNVASLPSYIPGLTCVTVTVNPGVYLYSTAVGNYGLYLFGATTGDNVTLINNGFIAGKGGDGGSRNNGAGPLSGSPGGRALVIGQNTTINNVGYIGGGGGGGAGMNGGSFSKIGTVRSFGGGGGAGGGNGGMGNGRAPVPTPGGGISPGFFCTAPGGLGGGPGAVGGNGVSGSPSFATGGGGGGAGGGSGNSAGCTQGGGGGGGGGIIFPGVGGAMGGCGTFINGAGGSANAAGLNPGSGGGGWGAVGGGGAGGGIGSGGAGGKAVCLQGAYSVTWVGGCTARVWGAVS
jgi:hypothetical protein